MNRSTPITALRFVLSILFSLSLVLTAHAQDRCSNATLQGGFGVATSGTISNPSPSPFAQVARQTFDGKGNTEGTATTNINGTSFPVTIKGTYTVNADCSGSVTLDISPVGITVHADLVIVSDGAEFRALVTDPGTVVTVVGKRQFRKEE